ncbi:MAG: hypothetical protein DRH43_11890 [Deltaproteobacteria bacterium]|nr:MAG: hypothetical protein DRH43_11890 [Deltaproteobacteria bacterium]
MMAALRLSRFEIGGAFTLVSGRKPLSQFLYCWGMLVAPGASGGNTSRAELGPKEQQFISRRLSPSQWNILGVHRFAID